jgi:uncharacterized protein DUF6093
VLTFDPFPTDTELADFQAAHEAGMRDACTIRRQTGTTTDQDTGAEVPTWEDVYSGKCRVRIAGGSVGGNGSDHRVGDQEIIVTAFILQVPVSCVGVEENDVATINSSLDPDLVNRTLVISSPWGQTHATARRFSCEESSVE